MSPGAISGEVTRPAYKWRPDLGLVSYGAPFDILARAHIERLHCRRVLIIVSGSLSRNTIEVEKLENTLGNLIVAKRVGMKSHSDWQEILDVTEQARQATIDLILTVGGGSITDAAKVIALAMANPTVVTTDLGSLETIMSDASRKGRIDIKPAKAFLICIPTTLSAGEYSYLAGATDPRDHRKKPFIHPSIIPKVVILDPKLGRRTPAGAWFPSGVRAMDHCIELLCRVTNPDPEADDSARRGLLSLTRGLLKLKKDPEDDAARLDTLLGSCDSMAGPSKRIPMGASHAIGHILGPMGVAHGVTSCIILPAVMMYNKPVNADQQKMCTKVFWSEPVIAQALEECSLEEPTADLSACLDAIFRMFGVPRSLREVGFEGDEKILAAAKNTLRDRSAATNPRPLKEISEVECILRMAL